MCWWLAAALLVSALPALTALPEAFTGAPTVQNDARHFIVSMQRSRDPGLFEGDLAQSSFASVTPPAFYPPLLAGRLDDCTHLQEVGPVLIEDGRAIL